MADSILQKPHLREDWQYQLAQAIRNPEELLTLLQLENHPGLRAGFSANKLFPLRVPRPFVQRMHIGDAEDPLLKQVITDVEEFTPHVDFQPDPLQEHHGKHPGLLHKYHNRVLFILKNGCAVHCRYCFRRHFPYAEHSSHKKQWQQHIEYLAQHPEIDEVILSGGDPLLAKDEELAWLIPQIAQQPHIQRLRIHTRLLVVIPTRATAQLCQLLAQTRLQTILVTHINHPQEIDDAVAQASKKLQQAGVTLLNQSVLLKGVNDHPDTLAELSRRLFAIGILPYYLHLLDRVTGTAHFLVEDAEARQIMHALLAQLSGYLVPRLTRELPGFASKVPVDLQYGIV